MLRKSIIFLFILGFSLGCSNNDADLNDKDDQQGDDLNLAGSISPFMQDLSGKVKKSMPIFSGELVVKKNRSANPETYNEAASYGGALDRAFGSGINSIYFDVWMADIIISKINTGKDLTVTKEKGKSINIPFLGGTASVDFTFEQNSGKYYSTSKTISSSSEDITAYLYFMNLKGGVSDTELVTYFNFSASLEEITDPFIASNNAVYGTMLFTVSLDGDSMVIMNASYGSEYDQGVKENSGGGQKQIILSNTSAIGEFDYKVSNDSICGDSCSDKNGFSIIALGNLAADPKNFILRKRAFDTSDTSFSDQTFVVSYDSTAKTFGSAAIGEQNTTTPFSTSATAFPASPIDTGVIGFDTANIETEYATGVDAANMLTFDPATVPQSGTALAPNDW